MPKKEYENAKVTDTVEAYKNFLKKYPDHKISKLAEAKLFEMLIKKNDYQEFYDFITQHPEQQKFVMFDGVCGLLSQGLPLDELCPNDMPELENIAKKQGLAMFQVTQFPGFELYEPPKKYQPNLWDISLDERVAIMEEKDKRKRQDCYPIPQWSAYQMGLFEIHETSELEGTVKKTTKAIYLNQLPNTIYTFIGHKVGDKYQILTAKYNKTLTAQ